jgi:hypothetical protein
MCCTAWGVASLWSLQGDFNSHDQLPVDSATGGLCFFGLGAEAAVHHLVALRVVALLL